MPPFILYAAADLYNKKVNLELTFPSHPTMGELYHHLQAVFAAECVATQPPSGPRQQFGISRIQLYSDDGSGQWRDLVTSSTLQPFSQIYLFQSDPNFKESQDQIPPARRPACYTNVNPALVSSEKVTSSLVDERGAARGASSSFYNNNNSASNNTISVNNTNSNRGEASNKVYPSAEGGAPSNLTGAAYFIRGSSDGATPLNGAVPSTNGGADSYGYSINNKVAAGTSGMNNSRGGGGGPTEQHHQQQYSNNPSGLLSSQQQQQQQQQQQGRSYVIGGVVGTTPAGQSALSQSVSGSSLYGVSHSQPQPPHPQMQPAAPVSANNNNTNSINNMSVNVTNNNNNTMNTSYASSSLYFGAAVSHNDKVHLIFEAGCRNGARFLQEGDFRALFRDTNIEFAPYVIAALFRQADADRDGVLTLAELQLLLKDYPTLTDALFFRLKDLQEGELLQQRLAEECINLEESKRRKDHAVTAEGENSRRISEQAQKLKDLEGQWQRRLAMEHSITERLAAEVNEAAALREATASHNKDLTIMVGRDDAARRYLVDAEREVQYCEQQRAKATQQALLADQRVKELLELLEAAKQEAAQQHRNVEECEHEVTRAKANEKQAAEQLTEFSSDLQSRKQYSEELSDELLLHSAKEKEYEHLLKECQIENEKLAQTIEHCSEDLRRLEHGKDMCRRDVTLADAAIADCDRRVAAADHAIVVFAQRRAATENKEKPLLEQEIRLKQQRFQLDESETMLRREAYNVFDPLARGNFPQIAN